MIVSGYRTTQQQQELRCRPGRYRRADLDPVAPPGHSEHESGYALDFSCTPTGYSTT
ncbi:MAG: D-alanyl-D-alanine carboxypeptidase family protein [Ruminococcus sp.]